MTPSRPWFCKGQTERGLFAIHISASKRCVSKSVEEGNPSKTSQWEDMHAKRHAKIQAGGSQISERGLLPTYIFNGIALKQLLMPLQTVESVCVCHMLESKDGLFVNVKLHIFKRP